MNVIELTSWDLAGASMLVLLLAFISVLLRISLGYRLLLAAVRMTVQLLLIGLVLKALFAGVSFFWILILSLFMLLVAGREVRARQTRPFTGLWGYSTGTLSMFISSFTVTLFALIVIIGKDPWYEPRYSIPFLGMILGNTMTSISIGMNRLTQGAWEQRQIIEQKLLLGFSSGEAIADIRRESIRAGMIPTLNAMASAGIVSLPGMMTGQILGGTSPAEAVKYQILIMFMIVSGAGFGGIVAVWLGAGRLFDKRHRLCLDRISPALR